MVAKKKLILIGKITKPQGLKGEVRVHYYGNDSDGFCHIKKASITKADKSVIELNIERVRASKGVLILKFKGWDSIAEVEELVGGEVYVNKSDLRKPDKDEYYWDDLFGIAVYDEDGKFLGELADIFETGSNDVYIVKNDNKEILIPAIKEVIKQVDIAKRIMRIRLLEGMQDDI